MDKIITADYVKRKSEEQQLKYIEVEILQSMNSGFFFMHIKKSYYN